MKNALKIVIFFAVSMCCALPATAQTAKTIVDKVINTHNAGKGISADYKVTSASGTSRGSIVMESTKYRILSPDLKSWFNNTTQWAYSPATGEVNVTNASSGAATTNPYTAIIDLERSCNMSVAKTSADYLVTFKPKGKKYAEYSSIVLTVSKKSYRIKKAEFNGKNHANSFIVEITNYVSGKNFPASTFVFDKKLVPAGTYINDLR